MRRLTARGPFDFSYSLLGSTFEPEDILFILMVGGGGPLFGSLNLTKIGQQVAYR